MSALAASMPPFAPARLFAWRRLRFTLVAAVPFGVLIGLTSEVTPFWVWILRAEVVALFAMLSFGVFEQWPAEMPPRVARWVLQVLAVFIAIPVGAYLAYWLTVGGNPHLLGDRMRLTGFSMLVFMGVLFAPWMALAAMLRQREAFALHQALQFQLERSELERQASDARLRLLQAQVQPHFLFNTLANVRALVRAGSPQAPAVLDSLIAYLRATVPHLDTTTTTMEQELQIVRAYLELMHMRMPDRLQFAIHVDEGAPPLRCPPMTLMTLVENAVRHGIDPSEDGGRIEVVVSVREGRCLLRVVDTGVGLQRAGDSLGTGLSTLRERLKLAFGGDAQVRIAGVVPRGVAAEVEFPAQRSTS
jgi:signal transduction histidine kinase